MSSIGNGISLQPPYPNEIQFKPYPHKYRTPTFKVYNEKMGNARGHVIQFIDDLGIYSHDNELRLREFSKSLTDRAYSWYANLSLGNIKSWDDMVSQLCGKFFTLENRVSPGDFYGMRQKENENE